MGQRYRTESGVGEMNWSWIGDLILGIIFIEAIFAPIRGIIAESRRGKRK